MAGVPKNIDELTAAGALAGTEEVAIWQSAATVKTTIADIAKTPGVGTATQIAYFGASGELTGDAALTFDSGTGTLAATAVQVGSTPFTFSESAGVMTVTAGAGVGGIMLATDPTNTGALLIAASGQVILANQFASLNISSSGGAVLSAFNAGGATLTIGNDGSCSLSAGSGGLISFDGLGTTQLAADVKVVPFADNGTDFGASDARWKTGYFGTSVVSPLFDGSVKFPTSDPMIAGAWWNNAGTLTISAA